MVQGPYVYLITEKVLIYWILSGTVDAEVLAGALNVLE